LVIYDDFYCLLTLKYSCTVADNLMAFCFQSSPCLLLLARSLAPSAHGSLSFWRIQISLFWHVNL
jgi:hypothetical protein